MRSLNAGFLATGARPTPTRGLTKEQLARQRSTLGQLLFLAQCATRKAKYAEHAANEAKKAAMAVEAELLVNIEMVDDQIKGDLADDYEEHA